MRKIKVHLCIGYVGAVRTGVIEVEDYCTPRDIDEVAREWADNYIEIDWTEEKA